MSLTVVNITMSNMTGSNIALLQLAKPVIYRGYIQPVCVDINNARYYPIGSRCWVVSWWNGSRGRVLLSFCVCFVDKWIFDSHLHCIMHKVRINGSKKLYSHVKMLIF